MSAQRPPRAAVRAAVRANLCDLEPGDRVVVALSGGADSLALTAATVAVAAELGLLCDAVVIDHQLQPGSGEVAARAAEQARILGCAEARVITVEVPRGAGSGGVEAAARAVRYAALDAAAGVDAAAGGAAAAAAAASPGRRTGGGPQHGSPRSAPEVRSPTGASEGDSRAALPAAAILLGHTREDQAETVLLGLARGSGTRSLAGMAARTGVYRRPLLDLPRDVVAAAAMEQAVADPRLEPWTDPHNTDVVFARVRVRRQVLPVLEAALGPGVVEALARTATLARHDADALDAWADQVWRRAREDVGDTGAARRQPRHLGVALPQDDQQASELSPTTPGPVSLPVAALSVQGVPLPPAIVHRVVRRFLLEAGCPSGSLTAGHIRAVVAMVDPRSSGRADVALPGGRRARRDAGAVVVRV